MNTNDPSLRAVFHPAPAGLTDDDLRAIEERAEMADPGPWEYNHRGGIVDARGYHLLSFSQGHRKQNHPLIAHARTDIPALVAEVRRLRARETELVESLRGSRCKANVMQFLWSAAEEEMRSDDPVEVRLRKDLDDADEHAQKLGARIAELEAENAKLRAENERLRENI